MDTPKKFSNINYKIMNNKKEKRIGLLNYEGDAIWAKKADDDEFVIYDQWDSILEIVTKNEFFNFLDGNLEVIDSEGKKWNFRNEHVNAKPSYRSLVDFITK